MVLCKITTVLGCVAPMGSTTTPERVDPRASDYAASFAVPEGIEVSLDCPDRFCVELSGPATLPLDEAALGRFMDTTLLPTFRDMVGFSAADHVAGCHGGRALTVHTSRFDRLPAFVDAAAEMMSHYRSPPIQVCAGTSNELD